MPPVLDTTQPSPRIAPVEPSALLAQRLRALRRRHVGVAVLTGVALTLSVAVELLALELFFDWWLDLPWHVRLLLFTLQNALFAYLLACLVVWPLLHRPGDDDLALMIEKARPVFRS